MTERLREELDYEREARHAALYGQMLADEPLVRVPTIASDLSTRRLLTMQWLDAGRCSLTSITVSMTATGSPPQCSGPGGIPSHASASSMATPLGNYTVFHREPKGRGKREAAPAGINLLDFGCVRIFPPAFVAGVIDLYEGLRHGDRDRIVQAYRGWGFKKLTNEIVDTLNIWPGHLRAASRRPRAHDCDGVRRTHMVVARCGR